MNNQNTHCKEREEISGTRRASHTPGPWSYSGVTGDYILAHGPNGLRCIIAKVEEAFEPKATVANTQLVAAAPELLQACRMLLVHLESMPGLPKGGVYDLARAAIARAEGRDR